MLITISRESSDSDTNQVLEAMRSQAKHIIATNVEQFRCDVTFRLANQPAGHGYAKVTPSTVDTLFDEFEDRITELESIQITLEAYDIAVLA